MRHGFNKYFLRKAIPSNVSDKIRWRRDKEGMGTDPLVFLKNNDKLIKNSILTSTLVQEVVDICTVEKHIKIGKLPQVISRGLFTLSLLDEVYDCSLA